MAFDAGGLVGEAEVTAAALSEEENHRVLRQVILPGWTAHAVRQQHPVTVFVAGQPGSGKTHIADLVHAALNRRGGAVRIGSDLYKAAHRRYAELLAEDVRTAGVKVRPDTRRWQAAVEAHVRTHSLDAVVETALADAEEFRSSAAAYRQAGARIEVVALATAEALSQLGTLSRFLTDALAGGGRYVSWENHDRCARQLLPTLAVIEAEQLADRITVVRRDGTALYDNELIGGVWRRKPAARAAVTVERARPWNAPQTQTFRRELARTDQRLHRELLSEDRRLAVQRDVERAAALAEPVRRIAQPIAQPPGVTYHRLSAEEHRWIFDELIVPSYLSGITAQDAPRVIYVMGQPGAGKTRAARLILRTLRGGPAHLVGDDFKAAHPDYHQLLQDNPRGAGAAIRADYRAWQTRAESYVRERRGDALIEIAPGDAQQFLDSALPFRAAGYRVELVVLAVRAADSRQGTAARYAQVVRLGVPGRFTTASGHDRCFLAVVDAVQAAEQLGVADAVVVMRRDGTAAWRNERRPDGSMARPAGAALALVAERQRPYSESEARRFLAQQRTLRQALPQYRAELEQITALARPLLPEQLRPRRLTAAPPVAALPLPARQAAGYGSVSSFQCAA
ncbi:zeta toxin family protein [Streptomyces olivaceiscleroticus]|uniref:zeta toxin family protein n=1 Tax=Streptomyces olivaceiscleroticus TaxID=68245 RepID=UPI0031F8FA65